MKNKTKDASFHRAWKRYDKKIMGFERAPYYHFVAGFNAGWISKARANVPTTSASTPLDVNDSDFLDGRI